MASLVTGNDDSDNESVYSENSETWNWRNAENNRQIIKLFNISNKQDKKIKKLENRLYQIELQERPHGGRRRRRKKRTKKRRKSRRKSRRKKRRRKKRTKRRR
jgi:hypothetical protein